MLVSAVDGSTEISVFCSRDGFLGSGARRFSVCILLRFFASRLLSSRAGKIVRSEDA